MIIYDILNRINSPADVKKLNAVELEGLASDVRDALFNRLTKIGGHFVPNFGIVEATIALHYVFFSPVDKFIFDEKIASYLGDKDIKVLNYGLEKKFIDRYEVEDLLEEIGLTSDKIIKRVSNLIK